MIGLRITEDSNISIETNVCQRQLGLGHKAWGMEHGAWENRAAGEASETGKEWSASSGQQTTGSFFN